MQSRKVTVAVIDSGYTRFNEDGLCSQIIGGHSVVDDAEEGINKYEDEFGHGTAVTELIAKDAPNALFYIVKSFREPGFGKANDFISALEFVEKHVECDIVHISAGVRACIEMKRLITVIDKLKNKNVVIVSAFDNVGALSYPASLNGVIGVDSSPELHKKNEYEFVESNVVNIRMPDTYYRVNWKGTRTLEKGSSFACTEITAKLANYMLSCEETLDYSTALNMLKQGTHKVREHIEFPSLPDSDELAKKIVRAVAFPFNKEIFSIAKYEDMLVFESIDYYDSRLSCNVGRKISDILPYTNNDKIVRSIEELDWDGDFDTLILGHINQYETFDENFGKAIVRECEEHGKRIFSFGNITKYYDIKSEFANNVAFPYVDSSKTLQNRFGKLRQCAKPVLMVCGTSSKQGKFSLQMTIKKEFVKRNYKVFHISTEPFGALLGAECTYPMGHDSTVYTNSTSNVSILNEMLFKAELDDAEIILTGLQSQSAPIAYFNMSFLPIQQLEMFYGLNPDAVVLVVNSNDDINYIKRTKMFIESATRGKVVALAMLPLFLKPGKNGIMNKSRLLNDEEINLIKYRNMESLGLRTFIIGDESEMNGLVTLLIDFF